MELAVNTFTGGLNLDTHPMVQSSETLSDALNATYITMNGNEIVLQNDMGNRRVDNAYLPAGYEPVGIKEHGGIIYVAAYNPITHRSQIGSFPSPERNMGEEYTDNGTYFKFKNFFENGNIFTKDGLSFLKDDIILLALTKDTALHAGDKFTIYSGGDESDEIWSNKDLITNFGTEDSEGKVYKYSKTPFNNYFTLSLGILNSQNEFSDITSTLLRFNSKGEIIKNLETDDEKFNTGYFIAPSKWKEVNGLTGSDASLLNERNKIGTNTYSYKLTGPLFLKVELNHIQTLSYELKSSLDELTDTNLIRINLFISSTATYNCPDNDEGFDSFELLLKPINNNLLGNYSKIGSLQNTTINKIYDLSTGNYISETTKYYSITVSSDYLNNENHYLNYILAVPVTNINIPDTLSRSVYLSNLSEEGTLDISKIGKNICELVSWRYKNTVIDGEVTTTLIDYRFDCYNDINTYFKDFQILLINLTDRNLGPFNLENIIELNNEIDSGRKELVIDWNNISSNYRIKNRDLYLVKLSYIKKDSLGNELSPRNKNTIYRFILGTELFNNCYSDVNDDYISDFGIFMGTENNNTYSFTVPGESFPQIILGNSDITEIRNKYLSLDDKIEIKTNPTITDLVTSEIIEGAKGISKTEPYSENNYSTNTEKRVLNITYNTNWDFIDDLEYPIGLQLINNNTLVEVENIDKNITGTPIYTKDFLEQLQYFENGEDNSKELVSITTLDSSPFSYNLELRDKIYFKYEKETRIIGKAYVDVNSSDYFDLILNVISKNLKYNGFRSAIHSDKWYDTGYEGWIADSHIFPSASSVYYYGWRDFPGWTNWMDMFSSDNDFHYEGWTRIPQFGDAFLSSLKDMKCPFTFMLYRHVGWNNTYYTNYGENMMVWNVDRNFQIVKGTENHLLGVPNFLPPAFGQGGNFISNRFFSSELYTRVWWIDEDGNPFLLNNFTDPNNHLCEGIFYAGNKEDDETTLRNGVYKSILTFLGHVEVKNQALSGVLVMPLENLYLNAWYPSARSYLYYEDTKVELSFKLKYKINNIEVSNPNNNCLNFNFNSPTNISQTKTLNKTYIINNDYSQKIFNLSQQRDLSNFSIDLETTSIISDRDPLKHLYIRKNKTSTILKEVPKTYPIQLNQGTRFEFPLVCRVKNDSAHTSGIGCECMTSLLWGHWGTDDNSVDYGILGARTIVILRPWSKNIPVLSEDDLWVPSNFFDEV